MFTIYIYGFACMNKFGNQSTTTKMSEHFTFTCNKMFLNV